MILLHVSEIFKYNDKKKCIDKYSTRAARRAGEARFIKI